MGQKKALGHYQVISFAFIFTVFTWSLPCCSLFSCRFCICSISRCYASE